MRSRDRLPVRWNITGLLLEVFVGRLFSHRRASGGRVMRYGSCRSQAPALLTGRVVAGPQGRPLVASSRLADAVSPLDLRARPRAVALPPITAGADDHLPVAPPATEHPVALLDGQAPATEDWTRGPPPAILTVSVVLSLRRWHRSPGPLVNPLQAWASSSSVEAWFYRTDPGPAMRFGHVGDLRSGGRLAAARGEINEFQLKNHMQGVRLKRTRSSPYAGQTRSIRS
jgi:hypothetical protein